MNKKILAIIFLMIMPLASALNDCPIGRVNDTYPGDCGIYYDANNDGICDHSQPQPKAGSEAEADLRSGFNLIEITLLCFIPYGVSLLLTAKRRITLTLHRKIWNVLLLASFLGVGVTGIIMAVQMEYGIRLDLPFDLLFWHYEFGIAMLIISAFHTLWHWNYFRNIFVEHKHAKK